MLNFSKIYKILNICGILQSSFSPTDDGKFLIRKFLFPYSLTLAFAFQVFILYEGYCHKNIVALHAFGRPNLDLFVIFVLTMDYFSYVALNLSTSLPIIFQGKSHCALLHKLLETDTRVNSHRNFTRENKHFVSRIKLTYHIIISIFLFAFPWHSYKYFGATILALSRYISINFHSVQYIFGHFYEMIVMEKVLTYFKVLEMDFGEISWDDHLIVREHLQLYETFWKIANKATRLFGSKKIICLTSVNLIVSFYWFCNYDRMENFFYLIIRQVILGYIFIICNNWHRLDGQVSVLNN